MRNINRHLYIEENLKKQRHTRFIELGILSFMFLGVMGSFKGDAQNFSIINIREEINNTAKSLEINNRHSGIKKTNQNYSYSKNLKNIYFLTILTRTEGYSEKFYLDNKGIAGAYGWNINQNNRAFNLKVGRLVGMNRQDLNSVAGYSNNFLTYIPPEIERIKIKETKARGSLNFLYDFYLSEFENVLLEKSNNNNNIILKMNNTFSLEQKAVFAHMAYKVGIDGLKKYNIFYANIISYLEDDRPTVEQLYKIKNEIAYVYYVNGQKKRDQRVQDIHQTQFASGIKSKYKI